MTNSQRAILTQRVVRPKGRKLFNYPDYLDWMSRIHQEGGEYIGQAEVNGKMTNVFFVELPFETTTVWIDPDTNLPVRVEMITWPNPNKDIKVPKMSLSINDSGGKEDSEVRSGTINSNRNNQDEIRNEMRIVLSNFIWNAELDKSLFNLEPPEGYTVEEK
jgi:outer membrane lipoprotein-sorting protein